MHFHRGGGIGYDAFISDVGQEPGTLATKRSVAWPAVYVVYVDCGLRGLRRLQSTRATKPSLRYASKVVAHTLIVTLCIKCQPSTPRALKPRGQPEGRLDNARERSPGRRHPPLPPSNQYCSTDAVERANYPSMS